MDAWVNWSAEVRQTEVEIRKGKITWPMNSFMRYCSAYADTQADRAQGGHRRVSATNVEDVGYSPGSGRGYQSRSKVRGSDSRYALANVSRLAVRRSGVVSPVKGLPSDSTPDSAGSCWLLVQLSFASALHSLLQLAQSQERVRFAKQYHCLTLAPGPKSDRLDDLLDTSYVIVMPPT